MNVFYIGVDNPVSITVPGSPEQILPSITAGDIRRDGENWIVYNLPKNKRDVDIVVNAVFSGSTKNMGTNNFRLKIVPDPIAEIGGKSTGPISRNSLLAVPYLLAVMPDWFEFDISYNIVSFTFVTYVDGDINSFPIEGNRLTPDILRIIQSSKKNTRIWFEDIVAFGPDGEKAPSDIGLKIN